ncbi:MAG: sporulation protein YabP [Clostridia bacterium]|nr:sporulation protein YabP [Clostridia bacterium]
MENREQQLYLKNRRNFTLEGVLGVESSEESQIILATDLGFLTVQGENLQITRLNLEEGQVEAEGQITALIFGDRPNSGEKRRKIWQRITK